MAIKRKALQAASASSSSLTSSPHRCWLMKAEPESRIEKGVDVAFSVDIFQSCNQSTSTWDGVRNPEASKMMREEMRLSDDVLFYHSNCKLPGIAGLAKVVKEGYPDYTAWDESHPYFDAKTDKDKPKWYMVDVQLKQKLPNLVPLALLQYLGSSHCTHSLSYLTSNHLEAIPKMQLLTRGRLSVQRVEREAFDAIELLGINGGWQDWPGKWNTKGKTVQKSDSIHEKKANTTKKASKGKADVVVPNQEEEKEETSKLNTRSSKRVRAKR